MAETFAAIRAGDASTPIAGRYPPAAFRDALAHDAGPGRRGKVLIHP